MNRAHTQPRQDRHGQRSPSQLASEFRRSIPEIDLASGQSLEARDAALAIEQNLGGGEALPRVYVSTEATSRRDREIEVEPRSLGFLAGTKERVKAWPH